MQSLESAPMASCHISVMGSWVPEADFGLSDSWLSLPRHPETPEDRACLACGCSGNSGEGHTCLRRAQARYRASGQALWMPLTPRLLLFWSLIAFSLDWFGASEPILPSLLVTLLHWSPIKLSLTPYELWGPQRFQKTMRWLWPCREIVQ